jgi:hypothetical protein
VRRSSNLQEAHSSLDVGIRWFILLSKWDRGLIHFINRDRENC